MKKIFLILIFLITTNVVFAQQFPVLNTKPYDRVYRYFNNGDYYKDTQGVLNPYIGTWEYTGNGVEFTIKVQKVEQFLSNIPGSSSYYYYDVLLVTYKLVNNNNVLVNNLDKPAINQLFSTDYSVFETYLSDESCVDGLFADVTNNVYVKARMKFELNLTGAPKIHFRAVVNSSTVRGNPKEFYQGMSSILSIPGNVTLKKID